MKKILSLLWLLLLAPSAALATTHTIDTFGGTVVNLESHTPDSGGPWTLVDGSAGGMTAGGNLVNRAALGTRGTWAVPVGSPDMYVTATIASFSAIPGLGGSIAVRLTDQNNYYFMTRTSAGAMDVEKRVAGTTSVIISAFTVPNRASGDTITLQIVGSTISVLNNGSLIASTTDTSLTSATTAGFEFVNATAGTGMFSRFESDIAGGGGPSAHNLSLLGVGN
jgi:hypothetical protein